RKKKKAVDNDCSREKADYEFNLVRDRKRGSFPLLLDFPPERLFLIINLLIGAYCIIGSYLAGS
ncbi:MAG: hypothetical protein AAB903_02085, partial [Patescibacteria group bacterium]